MFSLTHKYKFCGWVVFFLVFSRTSSLPHTFLSLEKMRLIFHLHCSSVWGSNLSEGTEAVQGQEGAEEGSSTWSRSDWRPLWITNFAALDVLCFTFLPTVSLGLLACEDQHWVRTSTKSVLIATGTTACLSKSWGYFTPPLLLSGRNEGGWKPPHQDKWERPDQASSIQVHTLTRKEQKKKWLHLRIYFRFVIISPALLSLHTSKSSHQLRQSQLPPSYPKLHDKNVRVIHCY